MGKQLCIIHANCQGDYLKGLLFNTPAFASLFSIEKYTNYEREEIPLKSLENCSIFIHQYLGEHWGEHSTDALLKKLPAHAQSLCIPNMFFQNYWPLWTNATSMAYGDILLEHLAQGNLKASEILHIYLHGNLNSKYDLDQLILPSQQREIEKEKHSSITTLDIIDEYWRKEQLFHTVNHPGPRLMLHVADSVLSHFGFDQVPEFTRKAFYALNEEFIHPIHPQVGKCFNLPFATKERLYNVYGQKLTFEQYTNAYIHCRLQEGPDKIDDFIVYLHLLAKQVQQTCAA